jgi:hypothetical protein
MIVGGLVIAIVGVAAVSAYFIKTNNEDAHAASSTGPQGSVFGNDGTLVPPVAVKVAPLRALDHDHPLNLWVGGDSLAGSFGPALGDRVGATGVVKTRIDYKTSSGLWSNDIRNWYQRATDQMASDNPDAVVYIIGANDTPVVNMVDANGDNVPDWEATYRMKVARMMDLLIGPNHRTVFWLGPPTLGTRSMDNGAEKMGEVMRQEAAKRAADVTYLDVYKLFSTADGGYSRQVTDETGKVITARISDGVHFTASGADYLARAVFSLVDARWKLTKQADLLHPIGWNFADGSGEVVPGYTSTPRSRYRCCSGSQSGSSGTTSPQVSQTTYAPASTVGITPTTVSAPSTVATPTTHAPVTPTTKSSPPSTQHVTPTTTH